MRSDLGKISSFWNRSTECWKCGVHSNLEAAHIIPKRLGGSNKPENLVILCTRCHEYAPDVLDKEYMWEWIKHDGLTIDDAIEKIMKYCNNNMKSKEYKHFTKIMSSKEYLEWGIKNTGQHGVKPLGISKTITTHNWQFHNYPPFAEMTNV